MRLYLISTLINKLVILASPAAPPALRHREEVVPVPGTAAVLEPAEERLQSVSTHHLSQLALLAVEVVSGDPVPAGPGLGLETTGGAGPAGGEAELAGGEVVVVAGTSSPGELVALPLPGQVVPPGAGAGAGAGVRQLQAGGHRPLLHRVEQQVVLLLCKQVSHYLVITFLISAISAST